MLEEPECGASGSRAGAAAAGMDCKDRPAFPVKKLIQARLPFKRLSLVPKERSDDGSDDGRSPPSVLQNKAPDPNDSPDPLESDCHEAAEMKLRPELVNGKGPLDNFLLRCRSNPSMPTVLIDLTEDSSEQPDSPRELTEHSPKASPPRAALNGLQEEGQGEGQDKLASPEGPLPDLPFPAQQPDSRDTKRPADRQESCPKLTAGQSTCPQRGQQPGWRQAGGILFQGKVPVVVLQDILLTRAPRAGSPQAAALDESLAWENEGLGSCPEEDSVLSHSSLSSTSTVSSPEGPPASGRPCSGGPCPAPTPTGRMAKKCIKDSTEKHQLRLQRDQERLGKQLRLQAEKEEKEKLKEEAKRAREEARKKKEEEKELKEKERKERREKEEKEKAEKQRLKEEKRKERQEALEAKLEEKRKKEEEKRLKEEEKRIKAEKAEITRFFQKPKIPQAPKTLAGSCGKFAPFEIKEHMVLAPLSRMVFTEGLCEQLDMVLQQQSDSASFLQDLKGRRPLRSGPTIIGSRDSSIFNSDVVIVESGEAGGVPERRKFGRLKLLQFSENHRPAYWGTWNKKTVVVRPRNPWAQDRLLDYEVDSDEEWEEEEPGESLSHSEGDDDDEPGEDEDDDDGFFVPHGYLSEDEGVTEECADPENHKVRQKLKAKEWDEFLATGKQRFRVLQPVKIGCVWAGTEAGSADLKVLQQFAVCLLDTGAPEEEQTPTASKRERRDQQILAHLLPLLHGNVNGSKVIIREFQEHCRQGLLGREATSPPSPSRPQTPTASEEAIIPSKAQLKRLISENSVYEKRPDFRMCWYVHPQVLRSFAQEHLPVPCQWTYVTTGPTPATTTATATATATTREDEGHPAAAGPSLAPPPPPPLKRKSAGSMCITQFMKKRRHDGQVGAGDMDGFQADTEEEEEEEGDCLMVDIQEDGEIEGECGAPSGAAGSLPVDPVSELLLS
ncbi:chromatin assembly factor 1 subunit A isoform X2 [Tenrec ecaudatus]|uniref:chromatin assembly factor 1 subunit A isoform X2 n=1 Tax=Tenrec ecaudatus TaxID=94439 RepID=UPI003F599910